MAARGGHWTRSAGGAASFMGDATGLRSEARDRKWRLRDYGENSPRGERFNIRKGGDSLWASSITEARSMMQRMDLLLREEARYRASRRR